MIYSQIRRIMPGNWSIIQQTVLTPAEGDWRLRQSGVGSSSQLIIERYEEGNWVTKRIEM